MKSLLVIAFLLFASPVFAGAWGPGSFDNDDALDWVGKFERQPSLDSVRTALKRVIKPGYLEAPEASAAIAAAEVLAAINGKPIPSLPASVAKWVEVQPQNVASADLELARKAVSRVSADDSESELRELWQDGDLTTWISEVDDLRHRLSR